MQPQSHGSACGCLNDIFPDVHRAFSIRGISCRHGGTVRFHAHRMVRPGGKGRDILPVSHLQLAGMIGTAARDGSVLLPGEQMPARCGKSIRCRLRLRLFFGKLLSGKLFQLLPVHRWLAGRCHASGLCARTSGLPGSIRFHSGSTGCRLRAVHSCYGRSRCRKLSSARQGRLQNSPEEQNSAKPSGRRSHADIEPLLLFRELFLPSDPSMIRSIKSLHQFVHALIAVLHPDCHSLIQKGVGGLRGNLTAQLLKFLQRILMQPVHGAGRHLACNHPVHGGADGVHIRPRPLISPALILLCRSVAVL